MQIIINVLQLVLYERNKDRTKDTWPELAFPGCCSRYFSKNMVCHDISQDFAPSDVLGSLNTSKFEL